YPYLAVTMAETYPRVQVMRGQRRKGTRYFGPYSHAWAIRETMDLLLRVFPIRSCSPGVFRRAERAGRPCLLGYIDKCSAPCVGRISEEDHRDLAEQLCQFMAGATGPFIRQLEDQMKQAADELDFERAARLRDDLAALTTVIEKNAMVFSDGTSADVFGLAADELEASVQVFHVRDGRIRGQRGWVTERVEEVDEAQLIEALLTQVYGDAVEGDKDAVPREVLIPVTPSNGEDIRRWLSQRRGGQVHIRVPQRGDKRALQETVHKNAEHALKLHKARRSSDLTTRSQALADLQDALDLPTSPLRIECFDISHTGGQNRVGSMVVFEDGLAKKSDYRHFTIRGEQTQDGRDDPAAMHEVIHRRFTRYLEDKNRPHLDEEGQPKRFAYPPNLVVVDGGEQQVAAAAEALEELGVTDVALVGLSERLEEVWLPNESAPLSLPRTSQALFLLQRIRDEAHRFALSAHRRQRSKSMTRSELDAIDGVGPARQRALLAAFGSVRAMRKATVEELSQVEGIGPRLAETIHAALHLKS
ncbi:MAG TPA: excinuclease ABC subunit UvrC, partial [Beutenbergiaceae bacterium]|nr:excinuclease ABC subunit UvrC [Beutenbergiaceae bacterium]